MKIITSRWLTIFALMLGFNIASGQAAEPTKRGEITGGIAHSVPTWFKESFLEIQDDVDEATAENRHVMLFFQLNGCPYCDRMLVESFESEPYTSFIQEHFDTIAINVAGDREIVFSKEISVTEKELSEMLKVRATPAIVFLNSDNKTVVRVNGYRNPARFQEVLNYVAERAYEQGSLVDYMESKLAKDVYTLRDNALFTKVTDLSSVNGPLAVIFEDGSCYDCNEFHDSILAHPQVQKELQPFTLVRLDADSDGKIMDVDGSSTTPQAMARKYEMIYRPGVLVFDQGELIRRFDSLTYPHHFKEGMRYVAGGFYKTMKPREYSEARTEELLLQGVTIDLSSGKQ